MRARGTVFVDSGAWIALALSRDPLHPKARESWETLRAENARLVTSIPVILETFTFLDRNARRDVALAWKDSLSAIGYLRVVECSRADLARSWWWFQRRDLHKLSAVDATSFAIMERLKLHAAFAFDHHFASAGFRLIG